MKWVMRLNDLRPVALVLSLFFVAGCGGGGGGGTEPETAEIQVTVTTEGSPEEGVSVALFNPGSGNAVATATTGANGTAVFMSVEPGMYDVEITPPTGLSLAEGETARKSVSASGNQTADLAFSLVPENGGDEVVEVVLTTSLTFSPADLTISPGTTVRWRNATSMFHTITPDGHSEWNRVEMNNNGETFEHTFQTSGEFPYYCEPHLSSGMTGTVTVQ